MRIEKLFIVGLLLVISIGGQAALPIVAIEGMQKKAPEKVLIEVVSVKTEEKKAGGGWYFHHEITVKITNVERTAAGLKKGDTIDIHFSRPNFKKNPEPGDWPGAVKKGLKYTAYLKATSDKNRFDPAASSGTFVKIKP